MKRLAFSSLLLILAGLTFMLVAGGCMTLRQEFAGHEPGNVWSAARAVAESPEYDDWRIITNEVWESPEEARLEVFRQVHRAVRTPPHKPRVEERTWRFRIEMLDADHPTLRFISRGFGIPAHARAEGNRYFRNVREMLGDPPQRRHDRHPREGYAPAPEADDTPPIDVDDVTSGE